MDGHFVPNLTIGPAVVKALKPHTILPLDVHLMISCLDLIPEFAKAGADIITIHAEATPHLDRAVSQIKSLGIKAGVSVCPSTHESVLHYLMGQVDLILVMTVNPGFGGQSFIPSQLRKIQAIRAMITASRREIMLQVDGGITAATAAAATVGAATAAATTRAATAAAAAVAAATTATTEAATTTAAAATTATAEPARALFTRTRFVDDDGAAFEGLAVHAVDGRLGLGVRAHLDETKALGAAGVAVHHDLGGRDGAELPERLLERLVAHGISQITYVQFVSHREALNQESKKPSGASTLQEPARREMRHPDTLFIMELLRRQAHAPARPGVVL